MSDSTRCRGLQPNGQQCICLRADTTYVDSDNKTKCHECDHIASAHPKKNDFGTLFKGIRDAAKIDVSSSSTSVMASQAEAKAETAAGLQGNSAGKKRKRAFSPETLAPKKAKARPEAKAEKLVKYGKAVFLPCGIEGKSIHVPRIPSAQGIEDLRAVNLVVLSSPARPLAIDPAWSNKQVNAEIARLFPQAIRYLQNRFPHEKQLWLGATAHKGALTLARDSEPTGVELGFYCKLVGRPAADRVLYLVSKNKIPKRHWDWEDSDSEDLGSDIDTIPSEDITRTPRPTPKPAWKGKGKAKELKVKTEPESPSVMEDEETDMRKAAKMRTRLSTGVIQKKTLFISDSSPEPSGSTGKEVVVVSDDDIELPRSSELLAGHKLPSSAPSPISSPINEDPPTFFDDFPQSPPPLLSSGSNPMLAFLGTSGLLATSTPVLPAIPSASMTSVPPSAFLAPSVQATPFPALAAVSGLIPDSGTEARNISFPSASTSHAGSHRFKKMGKGRV